MATIQLSLSSKADAYTGKRRLLVRFFHGKINRRAKTRLFLSPDSWNQESQKIIIPRKQVMDQKSIEIKNELIRQSQVIESLKVHINNTFYNTRLDSDLPKEWLQDTVNAFFDPKESSAQQRGSFLDVFDHFIKSRDIAEVTRTNFKVSLRSLERFAIYGQENLSFETLDADMVDRFVDFLEHEHELVKKEKDQNGMIKLSFANPMYKKAFMAVPETRIPKPRGKNTINGILKDLRTFVHWAYLNGYTTNNPFAKYKIGTCVYGTPFYPTIEERDALYNFDFSDRPGLAVQRDIFIFQCLVGCRVSDLKHLTKSSLINGAIEYVQRKTKDGNPITVRVPLNKTAKEILSRYKNNPGEQLLPFISDQKYNKAIHEIFRLAGLDRMVTILNPTNREEEKHPLWEVASSHMARRCFIGNLYKKYKDPNLIGSLSGHANGSQAFARYRSIDDDIKQELVNALED